MQCPGAGRQPPRGEGAKLDNIWPRRDGDHRRTLPAGGRDVLIARVVYLVAGALWMSAAVGGSWAARRLRRERTRVRVYLLVSLGFAVGAYNLVDAAGVDGPLRPVNLATVIMLDIAGLLRARSERDVGGATRPGRAPSTRPEPRSPGRRRVSDPPIVATPVPAGGGGAGAVVPGTNVRSDRFGALPVEEHRRDPHPQPPAEAGGVESRMPWGGRSGSAPTTPTPADLIP